MKKATLRDALEESALPTDLKVRTLATGVCYGGPGFRESPRKKASPALKKGRVPEDKAGRLVIPPEIPSAFQRRLRPPRPENFHSVAPKLRSSEEGLLRVHSLYGPRGCQPSFRGQLSGRLDDPRLPRNHPPVATRLYRQLPRQDFHLLECATFARRTITALGFCCRAGCQPKPGNSRKTPPKKARPVANPC